MKEIDFKMTDKASVNKSERGVIVEMKLPIIEGKLVRLNEHDWED